MIIETLKPGKRQRTKSMYVEKILMEKQKEKKGTLDDLNIEILHKFNRLRPANERNLREPPQPDIPLWQQIFNDFQKKKQNRS